jgi:hypothetical protein
MGVALTHRAGELADTEIDLFALLNTPDTDTHDRAERS